MGHGIFFIRYLTCSSFDFAPNQIFGRGLKLRAEEPPQTKCGVPSSNVARVETNPTQWTIP